MTGIFGWLAPRGAGHSAGSGAALERMSAAFGAGAGPVRQASGPLGAVASLAQPDQGDVHAEGGLLVACEGALRWRDTRRRGTAEALGHAAALALAYREHGRQCLREICGPFAVAVIDQDQHTALLAVDRMGIRPLCYGFQDGHLVFGSRADCVAAGPAARPEIDPQGIYAYLYFHMVPGPETVYKGIRKLLPAQQVFFWNDRPSEEFYWRVRYDGAARGSERRLAEELRTRLSQAVGRCRNGARTGTFLSGGLDSSTVTGVLARSCGAPVHAYAIGFDAPGYDEMGYAKASAAHFGATLHEYYVTPDDVVRLVPEIAAAYDEPFGNASAVPTYCCALAARGDGIGTLLAGDGGDEIFAGNARYAKQKLFETYFRIPAAVRRGLVEPLAFAVPGLGRLPLWRKLQSYIEQARVPLPDRLESYNFLHRTPLAEIFSSEFLAAVDPDAPLRGLRAAYRRAATPSALKSMLHLDLKFTLADNDLRKVNRMCELAGITVRYPMLDEELVEFSATIPDRLLLRRFELRSFYRRALADFLARETLDKRKHGFGLPFGVWLAGHPALKELACDSLMALKKRSYLNPAYLDRLVDQHAAGHAAYYGVMIWVLMMLEHWLAAHAR